MPDGRILVEATPTPTIAAPPTTLAVPQQPQVTVAQEALAPMQVDKGLAASIGTAMGDGKHIVIAIVDASTHCVTHR